MIPVPPLPGPAPVRPDLTATINTSISGYVVDESDSPVIFALVSAGGRQVKTDEYGYFSMTGISLPKPAGVVKVSSAKYYDGYRSFIPQENKETFVRIRLLTKTETGVVDAATGGQVTTSDGGKVVLPPSGVVAAAGGSAYSGAVHISARWIDPADVDGGQLKQPGDARATDSAGYLKGLKSYGILAVELTGASGQRLQMTPGKTAQIQIPISSSLSALAPPSLALWSFNDSTGLWRQETIALRSGNSYIGSAAHFSYWDGAVSTSLVNFKTRVVDASGLPLAHVAVSITPESVPQNAGFGRFAYTDSDGMVSGAVPANSNLVLDVLTTCANSVYSHPFTTASTDVDLGQVTGNLGQNEVSLSGTVTNCSGQPVTDGYLQTYDHGFYNRIPITGGAFHFTGLSCTNLPVNAVAVDNSTHQQSAVKTVTLVAGANDLGTLSACGSSTVGTLSYTIDGVTKTITEPNDTIYSYLLVPSSGSAWTQIVVLSGAVYGTPSMTFQFDGGDATSASHGLTEVFSTAFTSGRGYWPTAIPVTLTEYGSVGGFVAGSFSGNLIEFDNSAVHTFSCNFRIRRFN